jgi:hypothetical protein
MKSLKASRTGGMNVAIESEVHWHRTKLSIYSTLMLLAVAFFVVASCL